VAPPSDETRGAPAPDERPSKSQRKREARALFELGRTLVEMPPARLASVPLDDDIRGAIEFTRGVTAHVARKRELQHLAKRLRRIDAQPIREALEALDNEARALTARHHRAEQWRDRLIDEGDAAVSALCEARDDVDIQALRQLIRNAVRERRRDKPPASARALFRALRDLDERTPLPPAA
jgi:ribosome-associated protein